MRLVVRGRVPGTALRRGDLIAHAPAHLRIGSTSVRLRTTRSAAHAVRQGELKHARLVVATRAGQRLVRVVRLT